MALTITLTETTLNASRTVTIGDDAQAALIADALNFGPYSGQNLTRAQALVQWLRDVVGDLQPVVDAYQRAQASTTQITVT